jgi:hypothetical protein
MFGIDAISSNEKDSTADRLQFVPRVFSRANSTGFARLPVALEGALGKDRSTSGSISM